MHTPLLALTPNIARAEINALIFVDRVDLTDLAVAIPAPSTPTFRLVPPFSRRRAFCVFLLAHLLQLPFLFRRSLIALQHLWLFGLALARILIPVLFKTRAPLLRALPRIFQVSNRCINHASTHKVWVQLHPGCAHHVALLLLNAAACII